MSSDRDGVSQAGGMADDERDRLKRVFISYSHDSDEHRGRVLALANRLRTDGIDAIIDQFEPHPAEGWQRWTLEQIEQADFVLMVCTATYKQRFEGKAATGEGRGTTWEGQVLQSLVYDASGLNAHIVPVLLDPQDEEAIPRALKPYTYYPVPGRYDTLRRRLIGEPEVIAAPIGQIQKKPPTQAPTRELAPLLARSTGMPKEIATAPISSGSPPDSHALVTPSSPGLSGAVSVSPPIKILFLAANPRDATRLALDKEIREIRDSIRMSRHREQLALVSEWAVRPRDLQDQLLWHQPHIVHFSGHSVSSEILLIDQNDRAASVSGEALQRIFATVGDNVRMVVFNACFSEEHARAVTEHLDVAIGMNKAMGDRDAIAFAAAFYMGLGNGRSVQTAFDMGVNELVNHDMKYHPVPVLHTRKGIDPNSMVLVQLGPIDGPGTRVASPPPLVPPSSVADPHGPDSKPSPLGQKVMHTAQDSTRKVDESRDVSPTKPENRPSREAALRGVWELLGGLFDSSGLRRFLKFGPRGRDIIGEIPDGVMKKNELMDHAVDVLERYNLIDEEFFERLRTEFDRRINEIDRIARTWKEAAR
ncbi:MAG: TIR domain-containing protein [Proteobacteria bacterium]|nr:TIR domain-containing protein [Pseudomonadota bacterium]